MTARQHEWHLEHLASLFELWGEYLAANVGRLPTRSTIADLVRWTSERVDEPVNEPAVCCHCGCAIDDTHVCSEVGPAQ